MLDYSALKKEYENQLKKALSYLDYSFQKVQKITDDVESLDSESLEVWESFSARFSRVADIYLSKYVRNCILDDDPGFSGSFRDFMNRAEKLGLIDNIETWMTIRALRNLSVHEYANEDITEYFRNLKALTPTLLATSAALEL